VGEVPLKVRVGELVPALAGREIERVYLPPNKLWEGKGRYGSFR